MYTNVFIVDSFGMTKIHKDIAMRLIECVNDEEYSDQAIVKVSIILSSVESVKNVRYIIAGFFFQGHENSR